GFSDRPGGPGRAGDRAGAGSDFRRGLLGGGLSGAAGRPRASAQGVRGIRAPGGGPVRRAGAELARRPEPRRLLVVATDGDPDDVEAARQIIARCRAGGIEVLGLGIG
ncbi:hypothetical protein RZS08_55785, partial [Arthrospira platensis SPKY1]|nr:hypothetical protein [Arthrospira platensis SPKY1]